MEGCRILRLPMHARIARQSRAGLKIADLLVDFERLSLGQGLRGMMLLRWRPRDGLVVGRLFVFCAFDG
jgi:hypothetical protein